MGFFVETELSEGPERDTILFAEFRVWAELDRNRILLRR